MKVIKDKLYILGSDKRGTAYGILELSRIIGVSPWVWWADSYIKEIIADARRRFQNSNILQWNSVASFLTTRIGVWLHGVQWLMNQWTEKARWVQRHMPESSSCYFVSVPTLSGRQCMPVQSLSFLLITNKKSSWSIWHHYRFVSLRTDDV